MKNKKICLCLDEKLVEQLDEYKSMNTNGDRSLAVNNILYAHFNSLNENIEKIPDEVKKRIKYIIHIALNDRKGKYYNLLREEVLLLWELIK